MTFMDRTFKGYAIEQFGAVANELTEEQVETARCFAFRVLGFMTETYGKKQPEGTVQKIFCDYVGDRYLNDHGSRTAYDTLERVMLDKQELLYDEVEEDIDYFGNEAKVDQIVSDKLTDLVLTFREYLRDWEYTDLLMLAL